MAIAWRKHRIAALPQEHGAWAFLLSPLLIGLLVAPGGSPDTLYLLLGVLAAFLARQPATLLVKALRGRRPRRDATLALPWLVGYGLVGLAMLAVLVARGHGYLLALVPPGLLVFAWHLWLVARRSERRQMGVEIVASGVLALTAPAAYGVVHRALLPEGWLLWLLTWLQSAASIVYAYLRLEQRTWGSVPPLGERLRKGWRALLYAGFNLALVVGLGVADKLPLGVSVAYLVQALETAWGVWRPAVGWRPTRIGLRQMAVTGLYTVLFILAWRRGV